MNGEFPLSYTWRLPRLAGLLAASTLLVACAAGPNFIRPDLPAHQQYTRTALPMATAASDGFLGQEQQYQVGMVAADTWWQELGSRQLNLSIQQALENSPTLAAAQARVRQAQANYEGRAGTVYYPQASLSVGSQRQKFSPAAQGLADDSRVFSGHQATLGISYQFDLAGANRRELEALAAQHDYQQQQLLAARHTLAANIAVAAITQAGLHAQYQAGTAILQTQEQQLQVAHQRLRLGHVSDTDVLALQAQLEQTRTSLPALYSQGEQQGHLLAVLRGDYPGVINGDLSGFILTDFTLPARLPVVIPSELVRQRPDIQAAEALMHQAHAEYGAAVARLYPQLNLSAGIGAQALTMGSLFGAGTGIWNLLGQLTQPLFNPALSARKRAALAGFEAAGANYQEVVLQALRQVADVLQAVDSDAQTLAAATAAHQAASGFQENVQRQYALGAASYSDVLIAQQQALSTQALQINAQAQRLLNTVALYHAMAGVAAN